MGTNRKRISRGIAQVEVAPWKIALMKAEDFDTSGIDPWELMDGYGLDWEACRTQILSDWPLCSRPLAWFQCDAPRYTDRLITHFNYKTLAEPRLKVGGGGKQSNYDYLPQCSYAIFDNWIFKKENPPLIESEAAYLKRLDLLSKKELNHLEKHPELLEPIKLTDLKFRDGCVGWREFSNTGGGI